MSSCKFPKEILHAWMDGEAGEVTQSAAAHVIECVECAREVESLRLAGSQLRSLIDDAVGEVDSLVALQKIRHRIEANEKNTLWGAFMEWCTDFWVFHRRAALGLAFAFALGALAAPAVVWWASLGGGVGVNGASGARTASVRVESAEIEGGASPVVLQPQGSSTAVIWIDSGDAVDDGSGR